MKDCALCDQFTTNWHKRWGCIGNPDNGNKGCAKFTKIRKGKYGK